MRSTQILFSRPLIAQYDGEQAYQFPDPLGCIQVKRTVDGVVSALFLAGELPTMSAWDHGLYDRDYELITTDAELSDALADLPAERKSIGIPAGLRVQRDGETLIGKCLIYSCTKGCADLAVQIKRDGTVTRHRLDTILKPEGRLLLY